LDPDVLDLCFRFSPSQQGLQGPNLDLGVGLHFRLGDAPSSVAIVIQVID